MAGERWILAGERRIHCTCTKYRYIVVGFPFAFLLLLVYYTGGVVFMVEDDYIIIAFFFFRETNLLEYYLYKCVVGSFHLLEIKLKIFRIVQSSMSI